MLDPLRDRIETLERQNADLQSKNVQLEQRARDAHKEVMQARIDLKFQAEIEAVRRKKMSLWRQSGTNNLYQSMHQALLKVSSALPLNDDTVMIVYRNHDDKYYVRSREEFIGRFVPATGQGEVELP